jgi:inosose dehydratase
VSAITSTLLLQGYTGWFVVEQDFVLHQEPEAGGGPIVDARDSVEFLRTAAEAAL